MSNNPLFQSLERQEQPVFNVETLNVSSALNINETSSNVLRTNSAGKVVKSNTILNFASLAANKTVALTDANTVYVNNTTSNYTVTIPDKTVVDFPIGTTFKIYRQNTGTLGFSMESDEFGIAGGGTLAVVARYGSITIEKISSTFWMVTGDVTP